MLNSQMTEHIRREFGYNPATGHLTRKIARGGQAVGSVAGWIGKNGYRSVSVRGRKMLVHRVAWMHYYGTMPNGVLDHINRDPMDNRIANLRDVDGACNIRNSGLRKDNTSGHKGVYLHRSTGLWFPLLFKGGKSISLGYYKDKAEAVAVRNRAERQMLGA